MGRCRREVGPPRAACRAVRCAGDQLEAWAACFRGGCSRSSTSSSSSSSSSGTVRGAPWGCQTYSGGGRLELGTAGHSWALSTLQDGR